MAAERAKAIGPSGNTVAAPAPSEASEGIRYAQICVSDIVAGVHNFSNELPEVQALLRQLVAAIDAARAARQPDAPQQFQIATGNVTPEVVEQLPAAMSVVGQCPGDKRKRGDLTPAVSDTVDDLSGDEWADAAAVLPKPKPVVTAQFGGQETVDATTLLPRSPHEELRRLLMRQNEKQAQPRKSKSEALARAVKPY